MHRILVEEKRWVSESRFLHALNYCMLLPGPQAHQLTVYVGWLLHRTQGGVIAGTLFVLPGLISLEILSLLYATLGSVPVIQGLFFGLKAAVLAVVMEALIRIAKRALRSRAHACIAALSFLAIFFFGVSFPLIIIAAALTGWMGHTMSLAAFRLAPAHQAAAATVGSLSAVDAAFAGDTPEHVRPSLARFIRVLAAGGLIWLGPVAMLLATFGADHVFSKLGVFNSRMAVVTFGGAYAALAYMAQQAVEHYHWLKPQEMLVGLGFAETTPGPLISVVQFIGFMAAFRNPGSLAPALAGTLGGLIAEWTTFVPSFLWIFLGAPYIESLRANLSRR